MIIVLFFFKCNVPSTISRYIYTKKIRNGKNKSIFLLVGLLIDRNKAKQTIKKLNKNTTYVHNKYYMSKELRSIKIEHCFDVIGPIRCITIHTVQ